MMPPRRFLFFFPIDNLICSADEKPGAPKEAAEKAGALELHVNVTRQWAKTMKSEAMQNRINQRTICSAISR